MDIILREFIKKDLPQMRMIWNEVVEDGIAFPQMELLSEEEAEDFFGQQSYNGVAVDAETKELVGLYVLHPNNVGRCEHIANGSYAVKRSARGMHVGERLVGDSLRRAKEIGFHILQFNAVVRTNYSAIYLYEKLGFTKLGVIPRGFLMKDGKYEDIILFYKTL